MRRFMGSVAALAALGLAAPVLAQGSPFAGDWIVTAQFGADTQTAPMTLKDDGAALTGTSGPLDEAAFFRMAVTGTVSGGAAALDMSFDGAAVGQMTLKPAGGALTGTAMLYGTPMTITAVRPPVFNAPPKAHEYPAPAYQRSYSGRGEPMLRIAPGDRVKTRTVDNTGQDKDLNWVTMPGNTLTGPFFIEGAMPGDTLVVHLERIEANRDTAKMAMSSQSPRLGLNQKAVIGGYVQSLADDWDRIWLLDRARGVARLRTPGARLEGFEVPLKPMLGSIGVAPARNQAISAGDLGPFGGNMDFNRVTTGATLYIPVFRAGAWLSLGDGHAQQGDGEISGQGLETSLDVDFRVELIKGWSLGQVWMQDATHVMVMGIENSMDGALQAATTGLARWIKREYGLNDSEIAAVMSTLIEYEVAEVVDARPNVVAMIPKSALAMLRKP
jgi:amidase